MKMLMIGGGVSGRAAKELADLLQYRARIANDGETTDFDGLFDGVEQVVVSPGVKPTSELLKNALKRRIPVISELEFGFRHFGGKVLGITGTNGKTTTTELTTFLLKKLGVPAVACGNIGLPLSAVAVQRRTGKIPPDAVAVVEVSSFQLERVRDFAPDAAICLNLASDHIDRYGGSFETYCNVKRRIFAHVEAADCCYGLSFTTHPRRVSAPDGETIRVDGRDLLQYSKTALRGGHNLENLCGALELLIRCVDPKKLFTPEFRAAVAEFKVGRHRIETVLEHNGVRYVDDSKATNPSSVIAALDALGSAPVRLILGGLDKEMDFSSIVPAMTRVKTVYLIGETEPKLYALLQDKFPCLRFGKDFSACVGRAVKDAVRGDTVLLSPSCASMDMFKSYEERGDRFAALVREKVSSVL